MVTMPALDGVEHKFVDLGGGVTIHVADAGPAEAPPVILVPDDDVALYIDCMRQPGHAAAGSRWYRSFQTTESLRWMRGEFDDTHVDVPVRWLSGHC